MKPTIAVALLMLSACSTQSATIACPKASDIVPPSVSGAYFAGLGARLQGPDRANTIDEAVLYLHRQAPTLTADEVADILIAADCPNVAARSDKDAAAERARVAAFRAQVEALMGNQVTE